MRTGPQAIFISYAHQDATALAQRLLQDLTREACEAWLDTGRLKGGSSWTAEIERNLDRSDITLALLSRASYLSDIVERSSFVRGQGNEALSKTAGSLISTKPIYG
jgi:TIR domain